MESTIKKIFTGKVDEDVHDEFVKFSRGVFDNRYMVEAKKQPGKYSIKTGNEFANFFVRKGMQKAKGNVKVSGVIVSTFDIRGEADFITNVKQFMGIKQAVVEGEVSPSKILELMEKFPKAFFALSFIIEGYELKIKPKAPKSAKPSTKGEGEVKVDFCSLKTDDMEIVNDLFFDSKDFKEISISHQLNIEKIELPKGEKDPVKMRENALRIGKIVRKIKTDGNEKKSEKEFRI